MLVLVKSKVDGGVAVLVSEGHGVIPIAVVELGEEGHGGRLDAKGLALAKKYAEAD